MSRKALRRPHRALAQDGIYGLVTQIISAAVEWMRAILSRLLGFFAPGSHRMDRRDLSAVCCGVGLFDGASAGAGIHLSVVVVSRQGNDAFSAPAGGADTRLLCRETLAGPWRNIPLGRCGSGLERGSGRAFSATGESQGCSTLSAAWHRRPGTRTRHSPRRASCSDSAGLPAGQCATAFFRWL